jgi:hypothetical protein
MQSDASLSDDQTQLITYTLSQDDAENLTAEDAESIVSIFQEAGIQPGKSLAEAMESAGYDAKAVGDLARPQGPPPGGAPSQGGGINLSDDVLKELYTLLDEYYAESTSASDKSELETSIQGLLGSASNIFSAKA